MPEISRFFGIIIGMFYNDHPPPHFHVKYGDQMAIVSIETLEILEGELTKRVRGLVVEWALQHRDDLMEDWNRARGKRELVRIPPLE